MIRKDIAELAKADDPFVKLDEPLKGYVLKSSAIEHATGLTFFPAKELYCGDEPLKVTVTEQKLGDRRIIEGKLTTNFWEFI